MRTYAYTHIYKAAGHPVHLCHPAQGGEDP